MLTRDGAATKYCGDWLLSNGRLMGKNVNRGKRDDES